MVVVSTNLISQVSWNRDLKPDLGQTNRQTDDTSDNPPKKMASNKDESLLARIQSAISTVQAWDADRSLLDECRALIPLDILVPPADKEPTFVAGLPKSPYARDDDYLYQGNALLLQRMAYFFQKDVMTWINAPKCSHCGSSDVDHETVRGPLTPEEREGGASRVEGTFQPMNDSQTTGLGVFLCVMFTEISVCPFKCTSAKIAMAKLAFLDTTRFASCSRHGKAVAGNTRICLVCIAEQRALKPVTFST